MWSLLFVLFIIPSIIALIIGITTRNKVITLRSIALYFLILGGVFLAQDIRSSLAFFITALIVLGNGFLFDKITGKKAFQLSLMLLIFSAVLIIISALYVGHSLKNGKAIEVKDAFMVCENKTSLYTAKDNKLLAVPYYMPCTIEYKIQYANLITALALNKHILYMKTANNVWDLKPLATNCIATSLTERKCTVKITLNPQEIEDQNIYPIKYLVVTDHKSFYSSPPTPLLEKEVHVKIIKQN
ncbi:MAG: hypothetical protein GXN99_00230 [Candidatus Nanohaloarchaeota archaeon]|nr:hypothetical protein [Candidatus Nanohaloarchaeota archaeon]